MMSVPKQLINVPIEDILKAYFIGWRFDNVIIAYLFIIPFLLCIIKSIYKSKATLIKNIIFYYFAITSSLVMPVLAADIPYYQYFNTRMTYSILNWFNTPNVVFSMLKENSDYYLYMLVFVMFVVTVIIFYRKINRYWKKYPADKSRKNSFIKVPVLYILAAILLFAMMRGKLLSKKPINWSDAFCSVHQLPNQLGLNAAFTFFSSLKDWKTIEKTNVNLIDIKTAINYIHQEYNLSPIDTAKSPIAHFIKADGDEHKYNVVIVLMESMTKGFMGESGFFNPSLTPFLDTLAKHSIYFSKIFSDGIHTFNGVWSVLTSMPSIPAETNLMENLDNIQNFSGIGNTLLAKGYTTFFSSPHDVNFDNIGGTAAAAGFKIISSPNDFLNKDAVSTWGYPDHVQFEKGIPRLTQFYNEGRPFLATFLTVSNHGPWTLPNPLPYGCNIKSQDPKTRAVEYADWSLKHFIDLAQKQPWFKNTIFVFVADHGSNLHPEYEANIWYKRIPIIMYAPYIFHENKVVNNLGGQIDIFPTIMGILNMSYVNNTLGVDILKTKRNAIYFDYNSMVGAANDSLYYYRKKSGEQYLYKYNTKDLSNYINLLPAEAQALRINCFSLFQTSFYMIKNKKMGYKY